MHLSSGFQKNFVESSTPLNKANLLSDSVASSLGIGTASDDSIRNPNTAFNRIKLLIDDVSNNLNSLVVTGSKSISIANPSTTSGYASKTLEVILGFQPQVVFLYYPKGPFAEIPTEYGGTTSVVSLYCGVRPMTIFDGNAGGDITSTGFRAVFYRHLSSTFTANIYYIAIKNLSSNSGASTGS